MDILFRTKALESCYLHLENGARQWGAEVARKYIQRVDILRTINGIEALRAFPSLRYHPLKGGRKGQHAVKLTVRYRLIFTLQGERTEIIRIEEVSKHYDD